MKDPFIIDYLLDLPTGGVLPVQVLIKIDEQASRDLKMIIMGTASIVALGFLGSAVINQWGK